MSAWTMLVSLRRIRAVTALLLQAATTALVAACGSGATPVSAAIYNARFVDDTVSGLRFRIAGVGEGVTSAAGGFQFAQGRHVDFLIGDAVDRISIGTAMLSSNANRVVSFSLQHLEEVRAPNGDLYLANLVRLLVLLDSNNDSSDGFQIDAAANAAIGTVVDGTRTLDFTASAAAFANDATIVGVSKALDRAFISNEEALARYQQLFRR